MKIEVTEDRSLWVLEKVYNWESPQLAWNHPLQKLLGISLQYHSRFDAEHYDRCHSCYEQHLDFMWEQEMDARLDAADARAEFED